MSEEFGAFILGLFAVGMWAFLFWINKKEETKKKNKDNVLAAISTSHIYSIGQLATSCNLNNAEVIKLIQECIEEANRLPMRKRNDENERYRFLKNAHINYNRNELVLDEAANISVKKAIPGTEAIADALGGTIAAFKGALGIANKEPTEIVAKCNSCGASILGIKGKAVRCQYCDSAQQL